jgi:hypothetical protein
MVQDLTCHNPAQLKAQLLEFIDDNGPIDRLRQRAGSLLACGCVLPVIQASTTEVRDRFVDKVDQVRDLGHLWVSFCKHLVPA